MKNSIEDRRPVGRPRRTWLESLEGDMAELEINKSMEYNICIKQSFYNTIFVGLNEIAQNIFK